MSLRIFIVDDHEVVRRGLRDLIQADDDLFVVGEADSVDAATALVPLAHPDVVVLDVRLPDGNGIGLCRVLKEQRPDLRCIMLTSFEDDQAVIDAAGAGASAFLTKQIRAFDLATVIRQVGAGRSLLTPTVVARVVDRLHSDTCDDHRLACLSGQERRVLQLLVGGRTNRQIGEELHLAEKTVKNYVSSLLTKMHMASRTEAAVYAALVSESTAAIR